jgi:hypothetical protein
MAASQNEIHEARIIRPDATVNRKSPRLADPIQFIPFPYDCFTSGINWSCLKQRVHQNRSG